ncbi:translocase [Shewanella colwelliana]|uniref:translocase n=1 Tax=Shewanella colwelliana TaxID=23 RepID=UPI0011131B41|nr:translocase [Shewanella colwelliana]
MGGTASAQIIGIITLPFLTRIYGPEDFNLFAIFLSMLAVLSVSSCLRFEIAIPIPDSEDDAINLVVLSLLSSTCISLLLFCIIILVPDIYFVDILDVDFLPYLKWLPLGVWFLCLFGVFQYWTIRYKRFGLLAKNRISQVSIYVGSQIVFGLNGFLSFGLIAGNIISNIFAATNLAMNNGKVLVDRVSAISYSSLKRTFFRYKNYPKYSTFEAFANSAAIEVPVLIIAALSVGPVAGYLLLATRILGAPISLLGNAVGQVYLSHAPEKLRHNLLADFTLTTLRSLVKVGFVPIFTFSVLAPYIIPLVFGSDWEATGKYIVLLFPWFFIQFLVSPISMALNITDNQKLALMLQVVGLVIRVGAILVAAEYANKFIIETYAISGYIFYLSYLLFVLRVLGVRVTQLIGLLSIGLTLGVISLCYFSII